jgi:ElaB/YqjD/DUF883 family membrane-anchored ribosome-binding protein
MYTNIQQAVASVQNAFPSIYTKDDVIKLLESIEIQQSSGKLSNEQIEELTQSIQEQVTRAIRNFDTGDIVDNSTAEFSIGYNNTLELDSVDVDLQNLNDEIESTIESTVTEFFEGLEEESDEEKND